MAQKRRVFVCRTCAAEFPSWTGHCRSCNEWGTVAETAQIKGSKAVDSELVALSSFDATGSVPIPTGIAEVDRVLGGGFVAGSITLLGGEPGIGKSTLSLQVALAVAATGAAVAVVTGEEAPAQVSARASRLGSIPETLSVIDDTTVEAVEAAVSRQCPQLVIVDSIQTMTVADCEGAPGSVSQVKAAANRLGTLAKSANSSIVLIGHVTKDGSLAGPRLLEHLVDTVLSFSGDRHSELRFLRALKHRFGPTSDVGVFEMTGQGLATVADPSQRFLADRLIGVAGSVVVPALDSKRPVLVEVQALVAPCGERPTQLSGQGVSPGRLKLVSAVLQQRADIKLWGLEVFASSVGGMRTEDPGSDLGLALAIASAVSNQAIEPDVVACGELGLAGEVRSATQIEQRLQEAYRLGFRRAVVPESTPGGPTGLALLRVSTLSEALSVAGAVGLRAA